jgi:hypothetical protein
MWPTQIGQTALRAAVFPTAARKTPDKARQLSTAIE